MFLETYTSPLTHSTGKVTARIFISFLVLTSIACTFEIPYQQAFQAAPLPLPSELPLQTSQEPEPARSVFKLRHVFHHGDLNQPAIHKRYDVIEPRKTVWIESDSGSRMQEVRSLSTRNRSIKIHRLRDRRPLVIDSIMAFSRNIPQFWASTHDKWILETINAPDITDKDTVLTLAQMSANAYLKDGMSDDWKNIRGGSNWNYSTGFGWNSDGLKGYLYTDESNSTAIIAVKGTSFEVWNSDGTSKNDKENDNLFFSCCCGQQGNLFYKKVCNCATSKYTCNLTCLKEHLTSENRYYTAGRYLYKNVTALYPNSSIWLTGHSMGGSISSMIGLTYGAPVVTFEAVPDALPVNRLGIPFPPEADPERPGQRKHTGIYHFGHTADPIFMGTCNGLAATCSYAGYALESVCHSGNECVWDVANQNSTNVSILTHRINYLIDNIIKKWTKVPRCELTTNCYDCLKWKQHTENPS